MSLPTPHSHLGCKIGFDELVPFREIVMSQVTWQALQTEGNKAIDSFHEHEAGKAIHESSAINATSIGPLSGPEAGTGPMVPAGSLETPAVLVPNPLDSKPNPRSRKITTDRIVHLLAAEPDEQPYPTNPVPPEPTELAEPESVEQKPTECAANDSYEGPTLGPLPAEVDATAPPLPEHESAEHEWLRKEAEAKNDHGE